MTSGGTGAEAIEQAARPTRQHRHDGREGQEHGAGHRGRIAMDGDEREGQQEHGTAQRAIEQEREGVDAAEGRRAEQAERHHRRGRAALVPDEDSQQEDAAGQRRGRRRIQQSRVGQRDHAEGHASQAGEGQQRARPVDAGRRVRIGAFRQVAPGDPERGHAEKGIDEEDRLPSQVIDDPAAHQRPDGGGDGGDACPGADGAPAFTLGEGRADEGKRTGYEQRRAGALHGPGRDQLHDLAREAAAQRRRAEQRNAGDERAAPSEPVAGGTANQHEGREAERVGVDHPLQRARRGHEVAADRRQRHVDHGLIDIGDGGGQDRRRQHPTLLAHRALGPARRMGDSLGLARPRPDGGHALISEAAAASSVRLLSAASAGERKGPVAKQREAEVVLRTDEIDGTQAAHPPSPSPR